MSTTSTTKVSLAANDSHSVTTAGTLTVTGNPGAGASFVTVTSVPEPPAASLVGGLGILTLLRRRRRGI